MTCDIMESLEGLGLPVVNVRIGSCQLGFVVDTGSTHSLLDKGVVDQLSKQFAGQDKPPIEPLENADCSIMGIDGQPKDNAAVKLAFDFEELHYTQQFISQPLYDAFVSFEQQGYHIHGILGNDFLTTNNWIINYKTSKITNNG